jgi:transcriptional regulator with XRE-family HTH domain
MRQKNQALIDAMETQGFDAKDIAQMVGVTLPAVYNWIKGGKPREPQRAKLTELLGIEIGKPAKNDVEIIDVPEAPTVSFKINGAPKTNGVHPAPAKPISVRVSGDGLLVEVQVKHDTAMEVLEALGFRMGIASDWDEPSAPRR